MKPTTDSEKRSSSDLRPVWCLSPGGKPVPAGSKKIPPGVRWWCYEGDAEWTEVVEVDRTRPAPAAATRYSVAAGVAAHKECEWFAGDDARLFGFELICPALSLEGKAEKVALLAAWRAAVGTRRRAAEAECGEGEGKPGAA
jgi:hypothetical protein